MEHEFYDNTKLATDKTCSRKYYYRHVRQWRTEGIAPHLIFGLSWHNAMDVVWKYAKQVPDTRELAGAAMASFEKTWVDEGAPAPEDMSLEQVEKWNPRLPAVGHEMLINYINERGPLLRRMQLLSIEQPFVVPLFDDQTRKHIWYAGRKDKRFIDGPSMIVGEHKTTTDYKKDGGFKSNYVEGWYMSSQVMGYLYSDNVLSGGKTDYVYVDAALVHKSVHDAFRFIPVQHKYGMLEQWLFDTRKRVDRIRQDTQVLHDLRAAGKAQELKFMPVFSRNEESCVNVYGKCQYFNLCTQFPNPEQIPVDETGAPAGYIVEAWDPVDKLKLDQLIKEDGSLQVEDTSAKV